MTSPTRRILAVLVLGLAAVLVALGLRADPAPARIASADWERFLSRFVSADGRVLDTGNGDISHSEGQGYGMLLAVAARDRTTFDRLWAWTRQHLQVRDDHLFAWRWDPKTDPRVSDRNSAADGDILIAWALARAARLWDAPALDEAAAAIASDILAHLVIRHRDLTLLLPGPEGFVHEGVVTVNPSYWVFPAFAELDRVAPSPRWSELEASGRRLIAAGRFGPDLLPPDWLAVGEALEPSPLVPPVFGYNAIRVPLHLVWAGIDDPNLLRPFVAHAGRDGGAPPASLDLVSGEASEEPVSTGARAVLELARARLTGDAPEFPALDDDADYFASSLLLLSRLAHAERSRR